ncbi:MAG: pseudouridine synthase [Prevotellaceae bacterium]|nr:pseudouridine synthase [Prevotellaceae bacterium]
MEENEKKQEQEQEARGGYQPNFRPQPGRSPRPRIHQPRPYTNTGAERTQYKSQQSEEGGFRPEGFGAALQGSAPQRPAFRPRTNYNNQEGGYQSRGYQPRQQANGEYAQQQGGYGRPQQGGYGRPQQGGYGRPQQGGYGRPQQGGYGRPQQGGYGRPQQGGYGRPQQGGYGRPQQGGYGRPQQGGYGRPQQGGYGRPQQGGYGRPQQGFRKHTPGYDPNAKYSLKKRIEYKEENYDPNEPIRLNKYLANAGVCSRREADEYIQAGVITVNGEVVTELGTKVLRTDEVKFHDQPVSLEKKVYVLLNKPKDYVTTSDDPQQRKTVMDLVKNCCKERIYPVGRLDRNTTGVLLLTNDGDMASKLTHPKFLKKKIYHVYLDKNVTAHDIQSIRDGITLEDGEIKADACEYADPVDKKQVGIEIHSGKNRIVRRIFESLGYKVTKLDRVQFAGLTKKNLRRGDWRYLTEEEVDRLRMGAYE